MKDWKHVFRDAVAAGTAKLEARGNEDTAALDEIAKAQKTSIESLLTAFQIVKEVQRRLRKEKFHAGPIDGIYGPQTAAAVQAFQAAKGLVPDGEVGRATAKRLKVNWP